MSDIEIIAFYVALSAYAGVLALWLASRIFRSAFIGRLVLAVLLVGFIAQSVSMISRWVAVGHPPVFGSFENAMAGSWFVVMAGLWVGARWRLGPGVAAASASMALGIIWFGLRFDQTRYPLTISESSLWVDLHATVAWFAYAALSIAFILAVLIVAGRTDGLRSRLRIGPDFTAGEAVDELLFKLIVFVFVMQTAMLATGSFYEFLVFGRWWGWDPVESLSLAAWLLASLFIHLRRSFAWRGRPLAVIVIIIFLLAVIAYWLLSYFPPGNTFHVFDILTREHVL